MVTTGSRKLFAAVGFVAALGLSACGGGDGSKEIDALRQAKLISDKQAEDLKNMLNNVRTACRQDAQSTMAQIVANPTNFPPQALAALTKAANADPNNPSDNTCQQSMTEYRVLAASFQNEAQRAAADKDKDKQTQIDNLMNTNADYKNKVLLALIKAIGSEANYVQNYDQLLAFAANQQGRISDAAAQFGFTPDAIAQLNSELSRVQALTALRLAQTGQATGGTGVANGGTLGIGGGSGIGAGTGTGFGISLGQSGQYATAPKTTASNSGGLGIGQGASTAGRTTASTSTSTASSGGTLNLGLGGTGQRGAMRTAEVVEMAQNPAVLNLKAKVGNAADWFAKRRRANVTAY